MTDPSFAVQKAVYEALTAVSPSIAVYDHVPQNAPFPYITIDSQMSVPSGEPLASRRDTRMVYLSVWSRVRGQREVLTILGEIDAALHNKRLALDTGRMVIARVVHRDSRLDADGKTYMGSATVRIITERD